MPEKRGGMVQKIAVRNKEFPGPEPHPHYIAGKKKAREKRGNPRYLYKYHHKEDGGVKINLLGKESN